MRARRGGQTRTLLGKIRERAKGGLVGESWRTLATRSLIRPLKSDVSIGGMEGWIVGFGEAGGFEIVKSLLAGDDGSINPYSDFYIYIYMDFYIDILNYNFLEINFRSIIPWCSELTNDRVLINRVSRKKKEYIIVFGYNSTQKIENICI